MERLSTIETQRSEYHVIVKNDSGYLSNDLKAYLKRDGRIIEEISMENSSKRSENRNNYHIAIDGIKELNLYDRTEIEYLEIGDKVIENAEGKYLVYPSEKDRYWDVYSIGAKKISFREPEYRLKDRLESIEEEIIHIGTGQ